MSIICKRIQSVTGIFGTNKAAISQMRPERKWPASERDEVMGVKVSTWDFVWGCITTGIGHTLKLKLCHRIPMNAPENGFICQWPMRRIQMRLLLLFWAMKCGSSVFHFWIEWLSCNQISGHYTKSPRVRKNWIQKWTGKIWFKKFHLVPLFPELFPNWRDGINPFIRPCVPVCRAYSS